VTIPSRSSRSISRMPPPATVGEGNADNDAEVGHMSSRYTRTPYLVVQRYKQSRKDVYGSIDDAVAVQAQHLVDNRPHKTAVVAMHPIGSPGYLPFFSALARGGVPVVASATRYNNGDAALQMENVLLDLAACVRDAKERLGYQNVVLCGWSGGGSLMAGYQAEAEDPRITETAAGEPTPLTDTELLPGDGLMLIAAHRSRHRLLTEFLDPSVVDEADPDNRDPRWNLYDPANPNQPPYDPAYLDQYRQRQLARNRKITAKAKEQLERLRMLDPNAERSFVVHGTMADPRWVDPTVDPNGRTPGMSYLGAPALVNDSPSGLGRYTTTRSWLSQWSWDDAQIDTVDAAPRITVPTLVVQNGCDDAVPVNHPRDAYAALGCRDKQFHEFTEANHYFSGSGQRILLGDAVDLVKDWLGRHGFAS
jgi:pimeloyl-ACP methyl ester carboxylesterase